MSIGIVVTLLVTSALLADELPKLEFEKYTLDNGMDVILHQDHSIPMVSVNIWYHVGSKNEKPGRTGFAHLFEHMMFQGSLNADGEYFDPIQRVGGEVNGSTNFDRTNYWENVPSNYLELALWMESDRMGYLLDALTDEKLETQRSVVMNERRERTDNTPYGRANEIILGMMHPKGHGYATSVLGSLEDLAAATKEDVSEFFRAYYTPSNASLSIAGDFDPAEAKELIAKYFGSLPPGPAVERVETWIPELDGIKRALLEDDVELPRLYYVWNTPGYYAPGDSEFDLLASVLGSGKTSRLYKTLMYDKQIAQSVNVFQQSREIASTFQINVTAKPGVTLEELEQVVDAELEKLLTEGITTDELDRARIGWESGFIRRLQQIGGFGGRADRLNEYNTLLGDPDKLEWDMERYTGATMESVMEYAHKYIKLDKRAILHVVPHGFPEAVEVAFDRTQQPAGKDEPSFDPPAIQQAELSNGLKILLVEDHRLPLVQVNLSSRSGWTADPKGKFGLSSMTADLLDEGTKTRSALDISDDARMLGAQLGTGSSYDGTNVSLNALKRNLEPSLELMADVVLNPIFPEEDFERLRQRKLGQIQQEKVQPLTLAYKAFNKILYGEDHPYGQPYTGSGTEESLGALNRSDMENFHRKHFIPNNATVVIAGDLTLSEAKKKLEKVFGKWKKGTSPEIKLTFPEPATSTKLYIVDKPGAVQSVIIIGHLSMKADNKDALAFELLNRPLGGMFTSRINLNLREDKGYTYGAQSMIAQRRDKSPFLAYSSVEAEFTAESLTEFVKELRFVTGEKPLTSEEIEDSKNGSIKGFPQNFETLGAIAGQLQYLSTNDLPLDRWQTYVDRVKALDRSEINRAAKKHIHPEALVIVVAGDRALIEPKLEALNLGPIELIN